MGVKERLVEFIEYKNMNVAQFQASIGVSRAYVQNLGKTIGIPIAERIKSKYPEINLNWLHFGEGDMIESNNERSSDIELIPVVPTSAQAGNLSEFIDGISSAECEYMVSPIKGVTLAINIYGDSMSPEYPNGSKALVKKINEEAFIDWGNTFVLDTCNGVVIKNIFPDDDGYIRCHSINPKYPDFKVKISDIYGWYKVLMVVAMK